MLNEKFTLWLNTAGQPVEKPLSAMSSGEVLAALKWHDDYAKRLGEETREATAIAEAIKRGEDPDLTPEQIKTLPAMEKRLREAGEANQKAARLFQQVRAAMPQWRDSKLGVSAALRRYWPRS
jgi:hypothetical protein